MKKWYPLIALYSALAIQNHSLFAEAVVVDESQNYAMNDVNQAPTSGSIAKAKLSDGDWDDEPPLATEEKTSSDDLAEQNDVFKKMQSLQQEVQELRGQLEVLAHDMKMMQNQQVSFYKDIDARLQNNTGRQITGIPSTKPAPAAMVIENNAPKNASHSNPADEQISYLAAYDLLKKRQYDDAIAAMNEFIEQFPNGGYTANAHYWLGELYLIKNKQKDAIAQFQTVLDRFPSSPKKSASMLKLGYALAAVGQTDSARSMLERVVNDYPGTQTASLATSRLNQLKSS